MRITKTQIAGLAVALAGGAIASDASADTTVSSATTTPLVTSTAGNVTVASNGSIAVTAGQAAITVDSNNTVTNSGILTSTDASNTTGILVNGGTSGAISIGPVSLLEGYTVSDTNSDGDVDVSDGAFASGTNRFGLVLGSGGHTGDITSTGAISIEGQNSGGIQLNSLLTGSLSVSGAVTITGENSVGIAINGGASGGVTGDVTLSGSISTQGTGASALLVNAPITGALSINGTWFNTGYRNTAHPSTLAVANAVTDASSQSGATIGIHSSVGGGIMIAGVGTETDASETSTPTASLTNFGSAPVIDITADSASNLVVGASSAYGIGLHIRGNMAANGVYGGTYDATTVPGVSATGINISGNGVRTTTINGGIAIDRALTATAYEANATAVHIGANTIIGNTPTATNASLIVRGALNAVSISESASAGAYGVVVDAGASLPRITNDGSLIAQLSGEQGTAAAIIDNSNTLQTITNYGALEAIFVQTDANLTDGVPPPAVTGTATAIDTHLSNIDVTYTQTTNPTPFTDDDSVDDDTANRPSIVTMGDILFGTGTDHLNLLAGEIDGDVSFGGGAGAETFDIQNGATYTGRLTNASAVNITVGSGTMTLTGGTTNITSASFGSGSIFRPTLSASDNTHLIASGAVTFSAGASILPVIPAGLPSSGSYVFVTAGAGLLTVPGSLLGPLSGDGVPYVYNLSLALSGPDSLAANFTMKTPTQLGLNVNQTAAFAPIIAALQSDSSLSAAFATLEDQSSFNSAYAQLMPSYTSASTELATTAIQQQQSATTTRLAAVRMHNLNEVSAWAQEIGYGLNRESPDANGQDFRGHGFGLALGIDGPLNNGALFGLSGSFITSDAEEPARPDGQVSSSFGQLNAYLGTAMGPIDLDVVAGLGGGRMRSRRFIEFGGLSQVAEARWWGYEGHGMVRASAPMRAASWLVMTPRAALTYVALQEDGYTEEDGGALNIEADSATSQRLWADAGVDFSASFNAGLLTTIQPRLSVGYRANVITDGGDRTFRFASGGSDFTLQDDDYGSGGVVVGFGIDASNGYSTFSIAYEGEFSDQIERHSLNASLRYRF